MSVGGEDAEGKGHCKVHSSRLCQYELLGGGGREEEEEEGVGGRRFIQSQSTLKRSI